MSCRKKGSHTGACRCECVYGTSKLHVSGTLLAEQAGKRPLSTVTSQMNCEQSLRTKSPVTKVANKRRDFGSRVNKEISLFDFCRTCYTDSTQMDAQRSEQRDGFFLAVALPHYSQIFSLGLLAFLA